jgi:signal transduction histidine kinase
MASIIGLLDLLLDDDLTSLQRGNVMQIRECAAGLLGLLNDLLDISKVRTESHLVQITCIKLPPTDSFESYMWAPINQDLLDISKVGCLGIFRETALKLSLHICLRRPGKL